MSRGYPGICAAVDHHEVYPIHQLAREEMIQAKTRMVEAENKNRSIREFKTGEYLMLRLEHIQLPVWTVSQQVPQTAGEVLRPVPYRAGAYIACHRPATTNVASQIDSPGLPSDVHTSSRLRLSPRIGS